MCVGVAATTVIALAAAQSSLLPSANVTVDLDWLCDLIEMCLRQLQLAAGALLQPPADQRAGPAMPG